MAVDNAQVDFNVKANQMFMLSDKLADICEDMCLSSSELPPSLQKLHQVKRNTITADASLSLYLQSAGVVLGENDFESWDQSIRHLNITRTANIYKAVELRSFILPISSQLNIITISDFKSAEPSACNDMPLELYHTAISMLVNQESIIATGNPQVLVCFERLLLGLKTIKRNRESVSKNLITFLSNAKEHLGLILNPEAATFITATAAINSVAYDDIQNMITLVTRVPVCLQESITTLSQSIQELVNECGLNHDSFIQNTDQNMAKLHKDADMIVLIRTWDAPVAARSDMLMFLEEGWLATGMADVLQIWEECKSGVLQVYTCVWTYLSFHLCVVCLYHL